jgi:alginate O-acetyltransferase complex protein AlgI
VAFSSLRFLIFLGCMLALLALPASVARKKILLAIGSCFFYAAWDWRYLGLLLTISVIDYWCGARIARTDDARARKWWLAASVVSNLCILGYFKYFNFFIANWNGFAAPIGWSLPYREILLPAGISFYTFKSMSYTIDIYRREIEPCRSQLDYTTFVTFFPELIAGPIVRASVFLPQMDRPIGPTRERLASGFNLFLLGLTKKRVIADNVATIVDPIFAAPQDYSSISVWCAVVAYALQIYCDFSGYSDMAIACARMIGYDLPQNFDMPYLSQNPSEFWRRWHITLSSWLRDYLYIPLGGNRRGPVRTYVNLMITMLLGGLWHGASWNFVLWGGLHGAALGAHRMFQRGARKWLPAWVSIVLMDLFVLVCWVPFRSPTFAATGHILAKMCFVGSGGARFYPALLAPSLALVIFGHVVGTRLANAGEPRPWMRLFGVSVERNPISGWHACLTAATVPSAFLLCFWVLIVYFYSAIASSPFIYFQF